MKMRKETVQVRQKEEWSFWRVLMWPLVAVWALVATIIKLVGRIIALILGLVMMIVGGVLTMTVIGAFVGIPLAILGLLLLLRSLF